MQLGIRLIDNIEFSKHILKYFMLNRSSTQVKITY